MAGKRQANEPAWLEKEVEASEFQDARLRKRFGKVLERLWSGMGQTIPFACQDWAATKTAYRFLSNDRVSEEDILSVSLSGKCGSFQGDAGPHSRPARYDDILVSAGAPRAHWLYRQDIVFRLTMISRCAPQAPPDAVFTSSEMEFFERVVPDLPLDALAPPLLRNLIKVARLGGYLARAGDSPPGNTVMWRGMQRLTDIQLGYELALNRSG